MPERTAGLEPTPPYGKYGALRSCVRNNHTTPYQATAAGISAERHIFCDIGVGLGYANCRELSFYALR